MNTKATTIPNRIFLYHNDGSGRDSYISSNNGGFYKEYRIIKTSQGCPNHDIKSMFNPVISKPIGRYFCDGNGRDVYIFKQNTRNLKVNSDCLELPSILRNENFRISGAKTEKLNPDISDKIKSERNAIIARNLLKRIYYGNSKGLPERRMSPKVKFNKRDNVAQSYDYSRENEKNKFAYYYNTKYSITESNLINGVNTIAGFNSRYKY